MAKTEKTIYEIGYNFIPTAAPEDVAKDVSAFKDAITSKGGEIISDEYPKLIKLAYEMTKELDNKNVRFTSAYFGWLKFEIEPEHVTALDAMAYANLRMLRYIIVKTVRENTMQAPKFGKPMRRSDEEMPVPETESMPIDEEAVDKKIEELIEEEPQL